MSELATVQFSKIIFTKNLVEVIFSHCIRKNNKDYFEDETNEQKAYGLIGGIVADSIVTVQEVSILKKNFRYISPYKELVDEWMNKYAMPSITPLDYRGWIANPLEASKILKNYSFNGWDWIGSYHMHRVAWENDPLRDTPTVLDAVMASGTQQIQFIVSLVNLNEPILRGFYEGQIEQEVPIEII